MVEEEPKEFTILKKTKMLVLLNMVSHQPQALNKEPQQFTYIEI